MNTKFEKLKEKIKKGQEEQENAEKIQTQAVELVNLTEEKGVKLFHDQFGEPYAALYGDGREILKLRSKSFRRWIAHLSWKEMGIAVNTNTFQTALQILEGEACFDGPLYELHTRVALYEGEILYDLGDGNAVCINKEGWEIIKKPPILFYRFSHQKPQSHPKKAGRLTDILPFLNLRNREEEILLQVTLVSSYIPDFPHVIIGVYGPQGSAKSMLHRLFKSLIDPSQVETLSPPDSLREFVQVASHHWVIFLDNLSHLPDWLSDAFCRACTGDGFSKRELYSDDDDIIYSFKRVIGFNGINLIASKPDLLQRSILLGLESIPKEKRKQEKELWKKFNEVKPSILGAIFDLLVKTLNEREKVVLPASPRMADFTHWGCAIARALGYTDNDFLTVYNANINQQHEEAIEANPVGSVVMEFIKNQETWEGTPTELLEKLDAIADDLRINKKSKAWPKDARWVWRRVNEIAVDLEAKGIKTMRGKSGERNITLQKMRENDVSDDHGVQIKEGNLSLVGIKDNKDIISPVKLHYCKSCNKYWNNDPICPHGFDEEKLWKLYQKAKFGRIKFSSFVDYKKIEFWDKDNNFVGEYKEVE